MAADPAAPWGSSLSWVCEDGQRPKRGAVVLLAYGMCCKAAYMLAAGLGLPG